MVGTVWTFDFDSTKRHVSPGRCTPALQRGKSRQSPARRLRLIAVMATCPFLASQPNGEPDRSSESVCRWNLLIISQFWKNKWQKSNCTNVAKIVTKRRRISLVGVYLRDRYLLYSTWFLEYPPPVDLGRRPRRRGDGRTDAPFGAVREQELTDWVRSEQALVRRAVRSNNGVDRHFPCRMKWRQFAIDGGSRWFEPAAINPVILSQLEKSGHPCPQIP